MLPHIKLDWKMYEICGLVFTIAIKPVKFNASPLRKSSYFTTDTMHTDTELFSFFSSILAEPKKIQSKYEFQFLSG